MVKWPHNQMGEWLVDEQVIGGLNDKMIKQLDNNLYKQHHAQMDLQLDNKIAKQLGNHLDGWEAPPPSW